MRRLLILATALTALAATAPAANAAPLLAISDQQASTFTNPLYAPLKLKAARYIAPYDVMSDARQLASWDAWYRAAKAAKQRITISFEHSRTPGKEQKVPTNKQFESAMKAFRKAYPSVKEINVWNEINKCQVGSRTEGQPRKLCKAKTGAKILAGYYTITRKVFKGATIVPLNVLDEQNPGPAIAYIKAFKKVAKPTPKIWGLHNYSDTNRGSSTRTKKLIDAIGKKGDVWLLETGGIVRFGSGFPYDEQRAARRLRCMFTIAKKFPRVKRMYIYQFNGATMDASFDAGLISPDGKTRPGYDVVKARRSGPCNGR